MWLPYDNINDSRVIVTTRFQSVGAACSNGDGTDHLHTIHLLTDADSHDLFNRCCKTARMRCHVVDGVDDHIDESRGTDNRDDPQEIWKYCGVLPLAMALLPATQKKQLTIGVKLSNHYFQRR